MSYLKRAISMAFAAAILAPAAYAQYSQTIPEYSGSFYSTGFPIGPFNLGAFAGLPGGALTSGTISGTFGNSQANNSAATSVYLNSILVAQCVNGDTCTISSAPTSWSYTLTSADLLSLSGPTASLTAYQDNGGWTQLGATTLSLTYSAVTAPEPATLTLFATGLVGLAGLTRRRRVADAA